MSLSRIAFAAAFLSAIAASDMASARCQPTDDPSRCIEAGKSQLYGKIKEEQLRAGVDLFDLGEYAKAIATLDEYAAGNPQDARPFVYLALARFRQGDDAPALALAAKAIEIDPRDGEARRMRAEMHAALKDFPKAIIDYSAAMDIDPDNYRPVLGRANARIETGEYKAAIEDGEWLLARYPQVVPVLFLRANAFLGDAQYGKALTEINLVLGSQPENVEALLLRGKVHAASGEKQKAVADLTLALAKAATGSAAHTEISKLLAQARTK